MTEAHDERVGPAPSGANENLKLDTAPMQDPRPNEVKQDEEMEPLKLLCGVCEKETPKYKCPRCYLP